MEKALENPEEEQSDLIEQQDEFVDEFQEHAEEEENA